MKKRLVLICIVSCLALLYVGGYFVLRKSHVIIHFSDVDHWHPAKRFPGHFVDTASDTEISDRIVKVAFSPLMWIEQSLRNLGG